MKPDEFLKTTLAYSAKLKEAKRRAVAVGLPLKSMIGNPYGTGASVSQIGAFHEYGAGVPKRSFLRMPFAVQSKTIETALAQQFSRIVQPSVTVQNALGRVGAVARNVVLMAFRSSGFGQWPDIKEETKRRKGSSRILIDQGVLRGAITWEVR